MNSEGFWAQTPSTVKKEGLPFPVRGLNRWLGHRPFTVELRTVQNNLRKNNYRGISLCRLCGTKNGCGEFSHNGWAWPEGFLHYVREHNIKPSKNFINFIHKEYMKCEPKSIASHPFG